jgi:hypothetical protein
MIVSVPSCALGAEPVTVLAQCRPDPPRVRGADRRHVDEQCPGLGAGRGAVLAEQQRLDLRAVDDHGDHDGAALADRARAVRDVAAVLGRPLLGGRARAVVDRQPVAGAAQARSLARAHDPQPDEADVLHRPEAIDCALGVVPEEVVHPGLLGG